MRVLIPDGENGHALGVVQSLLLRNGVEIVSLSAHKRNASRLVRNVVASKVVEHSSTDKEKIEAFLRAADEYSVDIIIPVGEVATGMFAQYSSCVGGTTPTIPIPAYDAFQIAIDKARLAAFCLRKEIPCPRTHSIDTFRKKLENGSEDVEFPVMVKPVHGEGGRGIQLILDKAQFEGFDFDSAKRLYGGLVIQEYVAGYDIDLSLLALDGEILAYTIQQGILGRGSRFAASGGIEFLKHPELLEVARTVTRSLNYSGVAHLDFRCGRNDGRLKLVDMNCRFWGSLLGSTKAGVNFPWLACQIALGKEIEFRGFDECRYFDLLSVARSPFSVPRLKVKARETNLGFWISAPLANAANTLYRRSAVRAGSGRLR